LEIELYHHKAYVTKYTKSELSALKDSCKIICFRRSGGRKVYERTVHLLNEDEMSFPAPYFWRLAEKLDKKDIDIDLYDERNFPTGTLHLKKPSFKDPMYEDQKKVIERCVSAPTGAIIKMTGGGKSRIIYELIHQKKVKTLIIVPTTSIQNGLYYNLKEIYPKLKISTKIEKKDWETLSSWKRGKTYKPRFVDLSHIEEDEDALSPEEAYLQEKGFEEVRGKIRKVRRADEVPEKKLNWPDVTIICFQSLEKLPLEFVESVNMVIVDEGDTAACSSIRDSLIEFKNAAYRYFLTATFWRNTVEDTELLVAAAGNQVIYEEIPSETIDKKQTLRPKLTTINSPSPKYRGSTDWLKDIKGFDNVVKRCIVGNAERNKIIIDKASLFYAAKRRTIIFIWEEHHARILKKRLEDIGIESFIYSGSVDSKERKRIENIAAYEKDPCIIIATSALRRGTDTVNIDTIILADVRKNPTSLFQSIGRGTRLGDREDLLVVDFVDWFHNTTQRWSSERQKAFKDYYESKESFTLKKFKKSKIKLIYLD